MGTGKAFVWETCVLCNLDAALMIGWDVRQVRQVHQMAAARSLVEEKFLASLAGLPSQQLQEGLAAKFGALQEQAATLTTIEVPEEEVRRLSWLNRCCQNQIRIMWQPNCPTFCPLMKIYSVGT